MNELKSKWKSAMTKAQAMILVLVIVVAAIAGVSYYYATLPKAPAVSEVNVGLLVPLTGGYAYLGDIVSKGVQLAVDEINNGGGIKSLGGAKIKIITYDTGASTADATNAYQRLLTLYSGKLSAVLCPWPSGYVIALSEISEREKIPMLSTAWADTITQRKFSYIFRFCPTSSDINNGAIPALLDLGEKATGSKITRIAFLYDDNPATIGLINTLRNMSVQKGLKLSLDEMWSAPMKDATPLVTKLKASDAEIMVSYAINIQDVLLMVSKIHEMKVKMPLTFYGGGIMNPQFSDVMGNLTEGILTISDWNILKGQEKLEQAYLSRYGGKFIPKDAGMMYGVTWALKEAIEKAASTDPKAIRNALSELDLTSGPATVLYGRIKFKPNGDMANAWPVICQWQRGKIETVWPFQYATSTVAWPKA